MSTTKTLDQEALDHAARCVQTIQQSLGPALALASQLYKHGGTLPAEQTTRMSEYLARGVEASGAAYQSLVYGLGAQSPGLRTAREALRLDQLATPKAQRLLHALHEATLAAQDLDEERGWVDEDGECIGWHETLAGLELGLRREVHGTKGRD